MNIEILEIDKTEHEVTIQELHNQAEQLEKRNEQTDNFLIKEMNNKFLKEIEKEIEYQEFHIQELNYSLDFEKNKKDK